MDNVIKQEEGMMQVYTLKEVLKDANIGTYAVGSFSARYTKLIEPIMKAAINKNSPAIIQLSEIEVTRHQVSLKEFSREFYRQMVLLKPHVPLVLHLDHTFSIDVIKEAIAEHFTSVMIDASAYEFDKNVSITKEVTEYAHAHGVSVEAELGRIGTTDFAETKTNDELLTDPKEAKRFCDLTGVDALAVSVGTAHGIYKDRLPCIDLDRLSILNKVVDTPLVLHGASGVPDDMLKKTVSLEGGGVSKVNIATDIEQAMLKEIGQTSHITERMLNSYDEMVLKRAQNAVQILVEDKIENYLMSANRA